MTWTSGVKCACGASNWVYKRSEWTCRDCDSPMTTKAIKPMHYLQDCEKWLAAELEFKDGKR